MTKCKKRRMMRPEIERVRGEQLRGHRKPSVFEHDWVAVADKALCQDNEIFDQIGGVEGHDARAEAC